MVRKPIAERLNSNNVHQIAEEFAPVHTLIVGLALKDAQRRQARDLKAGAIPKFASFPLEPIYSSSN